MMEAIICCSSANGHLPVEEAPKDRILTGMRRFHTQVSQAHQDFIAQRGRSMDRLVALRQQMGQPGSEPVAPPMAPTPIPTPVRAQVSTPPAPMAPPQPQTPPKPLPN